MNKVFLSDVCTLIPGFAFKAQHFNDSDDKVIKITNITPPTVDMTNLSGVDISNYKKDTLSKFIAKTGDYVLAMTGATIGKLGMIKSGTAYVNQRVLLFKPLENKINKSFLFYVLSHPTFNKYIFNHIDSETAQPNISANSVGKYEFDLPDIDVQKKIAGVLSALDDKIELNNQINSNLEQQAQALLAKYNESINTKCPLGTVLNFANGFAFKSTDYLPNGKYKIITIKNVQDGKVDSQGASCINKIPEKLSETCILRIGDILLSLTGNVGRVGIVCEQNLLLNQRVAKILPQKPNLHAFLYFVLRQPAFKTEMENISKGTAQQNLSPIEMLNLNITYSETETNKISSTLDSYFDDIICNTIEIYNLNKIRDSLLPKLMSGEIDMSKVDISDLI